MTGFAINGSYTCIQLLTLRILCNSAHVWTKTLKFGNMAFSSMHLYDRKVSSHNSITNENMPLQNCKDQCICKINLVLFQHLLAKCLCGVYKYLFSGIVYCCKTLIINCHVHGNFSALPQYMYLYECIQLKHLSMHCM